MINLLGSKYYFRVALEQLVETVIWVTGFSSTQ
jgi:hypothetical protein